MTPWSPPLLGLAMFLACGCAATPEPCVANAGCEEGLACVAGRCLAPTADVASTSTRRVVLPATEVRAITARGEVGGGPVIALGTERLGETRVHLRFDGEVGPNVRVARAFLVLTPEAAAPGPLSPVEVQVAPILSSWGGPLSWGRAPAIGLPVAETGVVGAPRAPIRLDVSKALTSRGTTWHGLVVVGTGEDAVGLRLDLPTGTSRGPRLELFLE